MRIRYKLSEIIKNKKFKYAAVTVIVIAVAAVGTYIENHGDDAFVVETHTVSEDRFIPSGEAEIDGKININAASAEEFDKLEGIGETLSERIVKFREENGPFVTVESIMLVDGIGEKLFEDIKDKICVE